MYKSTFYLTLNDGNHYASYLPNALAAVDRLQVAQLSQRNRAAAWVSFGWVVDDGVRDRATAA